MASDDLPAVTYDRQTQALYVRLSRAPVASTDRIADTVLLDLDAAGQLVGIEVLDVEPAP